jgi:hypothetical protein
MLNRDPAVRICGSCFIYSSNFTVLTYILYQRSFACDTKVPQEARLGSVATKGERTGLLQYRPTRGRGLDCRICRSYRLILR